MDVGINSEKGRFKLRACGVIKKGNKVLVDKSRFFDGYIFIGGHIELGENSRDGVVREVYEELGVSTNIIKLIAIHEYIVPTYQNTLLHEIAYYYLLNPITPLSDEDFDDIEFDNGKEFVHHYKWFDLDELKNINIKPNFIVDLIKDDKENYFLLTDETK